VTKPGLGDGSVDHGGFLGADQVELADAGRDNPVAELEEEAPAGDKVGVNDATSPGAAVDGGRGRREVNLSRAQMRRFMGGSAPAHRTLGGKLDSWT